MEYRNEVELLNTLKSIDGTLKRIERSLTTRKQCEVSVPHAIVEEKNDSTSKENGEYLMEAVQTAIHDTFR